jgi:hypothetical protein
MPNKVKKMEIAYETFSTYRIIPFFPLGPSSVVAFLVL